jgi:hypothetical protein
MKRIVTLPLLLCFLLIGKITATAQSCTSLQATCITTESRCFATGTITVNATGGSGAYKYKATGPINTSFTTSNIFSGLPSGSYSIIIQDINTNCTLTKTNVIVVGDYQDPRFELNKVDIICENGSDGSITVINQQYGRAPYTYSIINPSPMGIGTSNNTGIFTNLIAGDYGISMTDSCGGIQTRRIIIEPYSWWIDSYAFTKFSCDSAGGYIKVKDNKGNISTIGGIPGFTYGIVRNPGDTVWSANPNFNFYIGTQNNFQVVVKDNCGRIKTANSSVYIYQSVGANVSITNKACSTFTASVNNVVNLINPNFCLYNSADVLLTCNNVGSFTDLPYGSYCIKVADACTDTVITRCFTATPPPLAVGANPFIFDKTCTTFSVSITGQVGLTNPTYCLYDSVNVEIVCNATGVFNNLIYSPYCITIKDGCRDTTIIRCFNPTKPVPVVADSIVPVYINCNNFGLDINGDSLTDPQYCLYNNGVLIICNDTGIFDSLALGTYCVTVYDACYDTTIQRCFTITPPIVTNDVQLTISNRTCNTFTVSVNTTNLSGAMHCLYDVNDILIICNKTGVFDSLPYGTYCIQSTIDCPDTTIKNCFTVTRPIPAVGATVATENLTCSTFTARITGWQNLTNPQFCIYDNAAVLVSCNTTGVFNNLPYGNYCIQVVNTCYDTTIQRCFSRFPLPVSINATASGSCTYGYGKFNLTVNGGSSPFNVKVYQYNGSLFLNRNYTSNNIVIDSVPPALPTQLYKVIITDACGKKDSTLLASVISEFIHSPVVTQKCPSGAWANGSGSIEATAYTNVGSIDKVTIIKQNAITVNINPSNISGNVYSFNDLSPATYILKYKTDNVCNNTLYDTVKVNSYQYPNLSKSSAYQCDIGGFSVGVVATGGVRPFTYEIIGSVPAIPSIVAAPQASSMFTINNGTNYSLVRLRAIDACGNGTLNDASILPLANTNITASLNCFTGPTTLSVDSITNAQYFWYKKVSMAATDSVFVGSSSSYYIPSVMPADTGIYVCEVIVNGGCINRVNYFNLNGACNYLPTILKSFVGSTNLNAIDLSWLTTQENNLRKFIVTKKVNNNFIRIGEVIAKGNTTTPSLYNLIDFAPQVGNNMYQLQLEHSNGNINYSSIIVVKYGTYGNELYVYPNPVQNDIKIQFTTTTTTTNIMISLTNDLGQIVFSKYYKNSGSLIRISRNEAMPSGVYLLRVIDTELGKTITKKILMK